MNTGILTGPDTGPPAGHALGLSSSQAAARLAAGGPNVLPAPRPVSLWRRVLAQLRDPLVLVLLAAAVLTTATGDWTDASVILLVIVVNGRPWQSMAFFALGTTQLAVALGSRARPGTLANPMLPAAVAAALALQFAGLFDS
jgi:Cation transporter/ATPase, N-terminus